MRFQVILATFVLASCGQPGGSRSAEADNIVTSAVAEAETSAGQVEPNSDETYVKAKALFNERANAINARMRENYERGQQACRNLREAGLDEGRGCPPEVPNYVELRE